MKGILIYRPADKTAPVPDFIDGLDPRLREKIIIRLYHLSQSHKPELKEPHFKRFSLERYRDLCELRVKSKMLIRIIFYLCPNGDVLLLHGFIKRHINLEHMEHNIRRILEMVQTPTEAFEYIERDYGYGGFGEQLPLWDICPGAMCEPDDRKLLMPLPETAYVEVNGRQVDNGLTHLIDESGGQWQTGGQRPDPFD